MTRFAVLYGCQLALSGFALALIASRARALFVTATLDTGAFTRGLGTYLERGDGPRALALSERLLPAHCAALAHAALTARARGDSMRSTLAETLADLQALATRSVGTIGALGRVAPPLAFAVALVELGVGVGKDSGLMALQRGLAESIALAHGMLAIVTGMATSVVCRACANRLSRRARALATDLDTTAKVLSAPGLAQ